MAQKKTLGARRLNMNRQEFEASISTQTPATQKRYRAAYNEYQKDKQTGNTDKYPAAVRKRLPIKAEPAHRPVAKAPAGIAPQEAHYRYQYVLRVCAKTTNQRFIYYMTISKKTARHLTASDLTRIADYIEQTRDTGGVIEWVQVVSLYDTMNGDKIVFEE